MAAADRDLIEATERWFLHRGTPHLIEDYRASEDVFTRTVPVLALVFALEVLGAAKLTWTWWQNLGALLGGAALLAGAWAGANRLRRRPLWQRPDDVGPVELAGFVVVPALLPVLFGNQYRAGLGTAAFNLGLLVVTYLVTSYGLVPMTRWAVGQTVRQVGAVADLFGRALPLLLLFTVALFVNTEVWQVASSLDGYLYWVTLAFFVSVGLLFLLIRLPGEVGRLGASADRIELIEGCRHSPLADAVASIEEGDLRSEPLSRRQRGNLLLVLLFSQAVQVLLVTVTIASFFFLFGVIAIRPEVVDAWLGDIGRGELLTWRWFGQDLQVSRALVHVAGFLGTLSGFYFTVYVITDSTYREEFFTEVVADVRESVAVRTVYLALRRRDGTGPVDDGGPSVS